MEACRNLRRGSHSEPPAAEAAARAARGAVRMPAIAVVGRALLLFSQLLGVDVPFGYGVDRQSGHGADAELADEVAAVGDDRRQGDVEPLGDLLVEQPRHDEPQYVDFALREGWLHRLVRHAAVRVAGRSCGGMRRVRGRICGGRPVGIALAVGVLVQPQDVAHEPLLALGDVEAMQFAQRGLRRAIGQQDALVPPFEEEGVVFDEGLRGDEVVEKAVGAVGCETFETVVDLHLGHRDDAAQDAFQPQTREDRGGDDGDGGTVGLHGLFVVIGFVVEDREGAVDLLGEDRPYDLVREGHARKRQPAVGAGVDRIREAVGSADDQHEPPHAAQHPFLEPVCELHRTHLVAALVEQDDMVAGGQLPQDRFALGRALLVLRERARVAHVGQRRDGEPAVAVHAAHVEFHERFDLLRVGFSDDQQFDVHCTRNGMASLFHSPSAPT